MFVIDGCTDQSLEIVQKMCALIPVKHVIIETNNVFETRANNAGLRMATQPYVVIVQDDQMMMELNWDKRLLRPFKEFSDIFAVTARTSCRMNAEGKWVDIVEGPVGHNYGKDTAVSRDYLYVDQVVNRGPLMIDHSKLIQLGYFDETLPGVQGCDDVCLCLKAYELYKWRCGCYWIQYYSPLEWGSTRTGGNTAYVDNAHDMNKHEVFRRYKHIIESWNAKEVRLLYDDST